MTPARDASDQCSIAVPESGNLMSGNIQTPWGVSLTTQQLDEGVFWVEAAEHGGILITITQARALLSDKAQQIGRSWNAFLAFEQERDMMVVFYEHPEWYFWMEEELTLQFAEANLRQHHPEYFDTSNTNRMVQSSLPPQQPGLFESS